MDNSSIASLASLLHRADVVASALLGSTVAALLTLFAGTAGAGDMVPMPSGNWAITSLTRVPGATEPHVEKRQLCVRDDAFDPSAVVPVLRDCKITRRDTAGMTTTWRMQCASDGRAVAGFGELTVGGEHADGGMRLEDSTREEGRTVEAAWLADRLGPCEGSPTRDDQPPASATPDHTSTSHVITPSNVPRPDKTPAPLRPRSTR